MAIHYLLGRDLTNSDAAALFFIIGIIVLMISVIITTWSDFR